MEHVSKTNIFGQKMVVKSGLEKIILKFHVPLQSCCCPVQKQGRRKVWKSGGGGLVVMGGDNVPTLVEIGWLDLLKTGPPPSLATGLIDDIDNKVSDSIETQFSQQQTCTSVHTLDSASG